MDFVDFNLYVIYEGVQLGLVREEIIFKSINFGLLW